MEVAGLMAAVTAREAAGLVEMAEGSPMVVTRGGRGALLWASSWACLARESRLTAERLDGPLVEGRRAMGVARATEERATEAADMVAVDTATATADMVAV